MALEPLYPLDVACELIPIKKTDLVNVLFKFKDRFDPPLYDSIATGQPRMLTERECLLIREIVFQRGRALSPFRSKQARSLTFRREVDKFLVG